MELEAHIHTSCSTIVPYLYTKYQRKTPTYVREPAGPLFSGFQYALLRPVVNLLTVEKQHFMRSVSPTFETVAHQDGFGGQFPKYILSMR